MLINNTNNQTLDISSLQLKNGNIYHYVKQLSDHGTIEGRRVFIALYEKENYDEIYERIALFVDKEKGEVYATRTTAFNFITGEYLISEGNIVDFKKAIGLDAMRNEEIYIEQIKEIISREHPTSTVYETKKKVLVREVQHLTLGKKRLLQKEHLFDNFDIRLSRYQEWHNVNSDLLLDTGKKNVRGHSVYVFYELELSDKLHDYYVKLLKLSFAQRSVRFIVKDKYFKRYIKNYRLFCEKMNINIADIQFARLSEYLSLGEQAFVKPKDPVSR